MIPCMRLLGRYCKRYLLVSEYGANIVNQLVADPIFLGYLCSMNGVAFNMNPVEWNVCKNRNELDMRNR